MLCCQLTREIRKENGGVQVKDGVRVLPVQPQRFVLGSSEPYTIHDALGSARSKDLPTRRRS